MLDDLESQIKELSKQVDIFDSHNPIENQQISYVELELSTIIDKLDLYIEGTAKATSPLRLIN